MSASWALRSPNWLGDAVMATVIPPALKRAPVSPHLTVLAPRGLGDVYSRSAAVDEVVEFDRSGEVDAYARGRYDRVLLGPVSFGSAWRVVRGGAVRPDGFSTSGRWLLLRKSLPGAAYRRDRHQVENYRDLAGLLGEPLPEDVPRVVVDAAWERSALELWPRSGARRVAFQPGATYGPAKRWPPERFARVAASLVARGHSVAVLAGEGERDTVTRFRREAPAEVRDLSGRTTLGVLAATLRSADLLITNDTGPMHLAAAVGTPTLALFGSTSPTWTRPWGAGHRVLDHPVPCAPCFRRTCDIGYPCLTGISTEEVERESLNMLERGEP